MKKGQVLNKDEGTVRIIASGRPSWDSQAMGMGRATLFSSELNGTIILVILTSSERESKDQPIFRLLIQI
jgi:hypothetical protein